MSSQPPENDGAYASALDSRDQPPESEVWPEVVDNLGAKHPLLPSDEQASPVNIALRGWYRQVA